MDNQLKYGIAKGDSISGRFLRAKLDVQLTARLNMGTIHHHYSF
jgi:hypothetical protein